MGGIGSKTRSLFQFLKNMGTLEGIVLIQSS